MKGIITNLDKAFENRIRLGIMSMLVVNDWIDFNTLKKMLDVTDGNLASHLTSLETKNYIKVRKGFIGKKPNTSHAVTAAGRSAYKKHLDALEKIISQT